MSAQPLPNNDNERFALPLHALAVSDLNVRKVSPGDIEALAASILADGVLQNLIVVLAKQKNQKKSAARYEIVSGKRRYMALQLLLKEKKIMPDYEVPVLLKERNNATVASLVENFHRERMNPIDEFKSFCKLSDEGLSVTEIALRLGILEAHVRQRLALGSASPVLLEEALQGRMSLDQLKVLCQVDSHETQNTLWFDTPAGWQRSPQELRKKSKGEPVTVSNKLVTFVSLDEYCQRGGNVGYDLFDERESTILDVALLSTLAIDKLTTLTDELGWSWSELSLDYDYQHVPSFKRVYQSERDMTETETATWEAWETRSAELEGLLESEDDHDEDSELLAEYNELCKIMDSFTESLQSWGDVKQSGGVYAYVNNDGQAAFIEGLIRKQDVAALEPDDNSAAVTGATPPNNGMSGSLKEYLACVRASIMQAELVKTPNIGFAVLCHSFVVNTFYRRWSSQNQLDIALRLHSESLAKQGLEELPSSLYVSGARDAWQTRFPDDEADLLGFLLGLDTLELVELLVFCSSFALTLHTPDERAAGRYATLAGLLKTDVTSYWLPTSDNFFNRLSKPLIFDALNHAGVDIGDLSDKMKKTELAARAGDLIKQNPNWLPDGLAVAIAG